jgi:hypothetical protein
MHKKLALVLACTLLFSNAALAATSQAERNIKPAVLIRPNPEKFEAQLSEVSKDPQIQEALRTMQNTSAEFSLKAILGNNLTGKPVKVSFRNLGEINPGYASYDALGMKNKSRLYIFINQKHKGAPPQALASLLSHEAMHQDEFNSINEETYAWTLEAAVWTEYTRKDPSLASKPEYPLVHRLNTLNSLYVNANYTDRYIRKVVKNNDGYRDLPARSIGFN